jgi:hypothetical protein
MAPRTLTTEPSDIEQVDLDPGAWLARDESDVVGRVSVRGGTLLVGALTQGEMEQLRAASSKINPRDVKGERIIDAGLLNRWVIAKAMMKANPDVTITPDQLATKLTGDLTEIARKILALSGFKSDGERDEDLPTVLPS